MTHDVFISHAVEDKQTADRVCGALEAGGVRCWIAPRDIPPGREYEEAIVEAIAASRVLVLIFSSHSNDSQHVRREVQQAYAEGSATRVIPFHLEPIPYNKALSYYLKSAQWIDATKPPLEVHLARLTRQVLAELERPAGAHESDPVRDDPGRQTRTGTWAGVAAGVIVAVIAVAFIAFLAYSKFVETGEPGRNLNAATPPTNTNGANAATPTPTASPSPQASPTPRPMRTPIRNFNGRLPANIRPINANLARPQP